MLNEYNPKVLLGPSDLQRGELNTWEAVPVTNVTAGVLMVHQWVSGAPQGSGSTVALDGLTDGDHALWLKARDRAGNLSPSFVQANWTVDSTAPSNCSFTSYNGVSFAGWAQNVVLSKVVNSSTFDVQLSGSLQDKGGPFAAMVVRWWRFSSHSRAAAGGDSRLVVDAGAQTAAALLQNLTDGKYVLEVVGEDPAGNRSPLPCANMTWAVDITPPVL